MSCDLIPAFWKTSQLKYSSFSSRSCNAHRAHTAASKAVISNTFKTMIMFNCLYAFYYYFFFLHPWCSTLGISSSTFQDWWNKSPRHAAIIIYRETTWCDEADLRLPARKLIFGITGFFFCSSYTRASCQKCQIFYLLNNTDTFYSHPFLRLYLMMWNVRETNQFWLRLAL